MSEINEQENNRDETISENAPQASVELPGRRLREQRESSHLNLEEVAHHLRLDAQLIKALEADDYSQLPSAAYICGYLRSYARLLKLPENEIVQAYNHGEQINAALIPSSVSIQPKKTAKTGLLKTVVVIVFVVLVAGGLYLISDKFDFFRTGRSQKSSQLTVPPAVTTAPEQESKVSAPAPESEPQTPEAPAPDTQQPAQPPVKVEPGKTVVENLPTPKSTITNAPAPETKPQEVAPAGQTTQAHQVNPTAQQQNSSPVNTAQLHIHCNADSWVEVTDNTGKRLLYRLVEKNSDLNLDGEPPFTILLGNAPEVQVFYDGKEFDHTRYHRDDVAYFKIGTK